MEFNKPTANFKPAGEALTPYEKAKTEWDNRIGTARVQAYNWRLMAFSLAVVVLMLLGGLVYMATRSSVTPYVIQVNNDGVVQAVGPAKEAIYTPQEPEIKHFLSQFVTKVRSVPLDPVVVRQNWISAYAFMRQTAASKMNEEIKKDDPLSRMGRELVQVTIKTVVPLSGDTFQVRWNEDVFTKEGALKESYKMSGLFTVEFSQPKTEKDLLANPLGLYIKSFSWSREVSG